MPFKYNPITNQLDITGTSGGGGGIATINSISPDGSGNFTLTAGTNITLTPESNGLEISASGGGTYYSISPYVVGSDSHSQFTTIQAAIDQAITDGVSAANPLNIYIKNGTYTENLTGSDGISIIGLGWGGVTHGNSIPVYPVIWTGTLTFPSGTMTFENIQFSAPNSAVTVVTIPGSSKVNIINCLMSDVFEAATYIGFSGDNAYIFLNNTLAVTGPFYSNSNSNQSFFAENCNLQTSNFTENGFTNYFFLNCSQVPTIQLGSGSTFASIAATNCGMSANGVLLGASSTYTGAMNVTLNYCTFENSSGILFVNPASAQQSLYILNFCQGVLFSFSFGILHDLATTGNPLTTLTLNTCNIVEKAPSQIGKSGTFNSVSSSGILLPILGSLATANISNSFISGSSFNPYSVVTNSNITNQGDTDGFLSVPAVAGAPSGPPTLYGASIPMVYDSTDNIPYYYSNGAWQGSPSYYSLTPYICGPVGDTHAQFTGDTAIAEAIAKIITDRPTNATIYIKPGTYNNGSNPITIPTGPNIVLYGLGLPSTGVSPAIVTTVLIGSPIVGNGSVFATAVTISAEITMGAGENSFFGCNLTSADINNSAPINCYFTNCSLTSTVTANASNQLVCYFDNCYIGGTITAGSNGSDAFYVQYSLLAATTSLLNTATVSPLLIMSQCTCTSTIFLDDTLATVPWLAVIDGLALIDVNEAFVLNPAVNWTSINNISSSATLGTFLIDTAGSGSNTILFTNLGINATNTLILSDNDTITVNESTFVGAITSGSSTNITLNNCNTSGSPAPTGGAGSIVNYIGTVNPGAGFVINSSALATSATDGFLYVDSCAGVPTGVPAVYGEAIPMVYDSTDNVPYYYSNGAWQGSSGGTGISSVVTQTFTSTGTYTPTAGMAYCTIEVVGGGGGAGSAYIGGGGSFFVSGGGGGGGYDKGVFSAASIGASQTVTIGAAGAGGSSGGANSGGTGGTSSVGSLISATGGVGSLSAYVSNAGVVSGGAGGAGSGGDLGTVGSPGSTGSQFYSPGGTSGVSGNGGSSYFGGGALGVVALSTTSTNGSAATSYGGGGSGGVSTIGGASSSGGAGFIGVVYITEYIA